MKKNIITIFALLMISFKMQGQTAIDIAETTFKIKGFGGELLNYGFSEGDQIIFNFEEVNGKEMKEVEIIEMPSSSKFMDYKTKKIENKILNVNRTGIYQFRFSNSAINGRVCKIKIQRIPISEKTRNFNTSVYFKRIQDTTFSPKEEKYLVKSDTIAQEIYSSSPQISSTTALNGNKNSQVIDFSLPRNTISWSFYIGTGSESKEEFERARDNFSQNLASTVAPIPGYGAMAALALTGVSYFNKVQGEDNVKYWFLSDINSVKLFEATQQFMQYKKGDVVNEASQMKSPLSGKVYIALLNDNTIDPIKVTIKATAITVNQEWKTRLIQEMKITEREEAYLK